MTTSSWLEIGKPSFSAKQIGAWRADPLVPGMRIDLAGRDSLGIGRLATDELRAGTLSDDKHYCRIARRSGDAAGFSITGSRTTGLGGGSLGASPAALKDGDVVDGGAVRFRFRSGEPPDALLGVAWRAADHVIAYPCAFPQLRRFRALFLDGDEPRMGSVYVDHEPTRPDEALGRPIARSLNAMVVELPVVDGPTLRVLFDRSRAMGATVDAAYLAEMCASVEGVVAAFDDVVVGFDGAVRSSWLLRESASAMAPGVRLRRLLEAMQRPVAPESDRAGREALAAFVRQLFPAEAARIAAIAEEAPMLSCAAWRERVS